MHDGEENTKDGREMLDVEAGAGSSTVQSGDPALAGRESDDGNGIEDRNECSQLLEEGAGSAWLGFTITGNPCLLTSDLFLLFTSLLSHYPAGEPAASPSTAQDLSSYFETYAREQEGNRVDCGIDWDSESSGAHIGRLVRVVYTAHIAQQLVALHDATCSSSNW